MPRHFESHDHTDLFEYLPSLPKPLPPVATGNSSTIATINSNSKSNANVNNTNASDRQIVESDTKIQTDIQRSKPNRSNTALEYRLVEFEKSQRESLVEINKIHGHLNESFRFMEYNNYGLKDQISYFRELLGSVQRHLNFLDQRGIETSGNITRLHDQTRHDSNQLNSLNSRIDSNYKNFENVNLEILSLKKEISDSKEEFSKQIQQLLTKISILESEKSILSSFIREIDNRLSGSAKIGDSNLVKTAQVLLNVSKLQGDYDKKEILDLKQEYDSKIKDLQETLLKQTALQSDLKESLEIFKSNYERDSYKIDNLEKLLTSHISSIRQDRWLENSEIIKTVSTLKNSFTCKKKGDLESFSCIIKSLQALKSQFEDEIYNLKKELEDSKTQNFKIWN